MSPAWPGSRQLAAGRRSTVAELAGVATEVCRWPVPARCAAAAAEMEGESKKEGRYFCRALFLHPSLRPPTHLWSFINASSPSLLHLRPSLHPSLPVLPHSSALSLWISLFPTTPPSLLHTLQLGGDSYESLWSAAGSPPCRAHLRPSYTAAPLAPAPEGRSNRLALRGRRGLALGWFREREGEGARARRAVSHTRRAAS